MEDHSEKEIWQLIKTCLDAYAAKVNAKGEREYALVYPILLSLGPRLLENYAENSRQ